MLWLALGDYRGPGRADAFLCYSLEIYRQRCLDSVYREYVADSLHYMGQGSYIGARLHDLLNPLPDFDAESIVEEVISKAGLEVIR